MDRSGNSIKLTGIREESLLLPGPFSVFLFFLLSHGHWMAGIEIEKRERKERLMSESRDQEDTIS